MDAGTSTFTLAQKVADLTSWLAPVLDRFPAREKWALTAEIKRCCYTLQRRAIRIQKRNQKYAEIVAFDEDLDFLRYLLRHSHERQFLKHRAHKHAFALVNEIGKIAGGLTKAYQRQGARP